VRLHAARYFSDAGDPSPVTAEDFWQAIDRYGLGESISLVADLWDLPQSDFACSRLLAALRSGPGEEIEYHLQRAVQWVDFPVLAARREELLSFEPLFPHVRDHLAERLRLADLLLDELWEGLLRDSRDNDRNAVGEFDHRVADRLVEALARHGAPAAERALARLRDDSGQDWIEIYCVDLLGRLRHAPATAILVERLQVDADLLTDRVVTALGRIGTIEVVERLEELYSRSDWDVRLYADDPLPRIKRPESEAALLRLLEKEEEPDLAAGLAAGLCELCTTEGLEAVRRVIVEERYDPQIAELDELLLTVGTMVGYQPPEAAQWRKQIERREKERARRMAKLGGPLGLTVFREVLERFRRGEPPWPRAERAKDNDSDDAEDDLPLEALPAFTAAHPARAAVAPIKREAPKVGCNDPCPCGSGKKYKKCCLRADEGP
jgi:hypothetical protein